MENGECLGSNLRPKNMRLQHEVYLKEQDGPELWTRGVEEAASAEPD